MRFLYPDIHRSCCIYHSSGAVSTRVDYRRRFRQCLSVDDSVGARRTKISELEFLDGMQKESFE